MRLSREEQQKYGEVVRKVFQRYGISSAAYEWSELPNKRKHPHIEAAEAAITAYLRDQAAKDGSDGNDAGR